MPLLGGSWVVISGVISPLIWVISIVTLLTTQLITTHEPPSVAILESWSLVLGLGCWFWEWGSELLGHRVLQLVYTFKRTSVLMTSRALGFEGLRSELCVAGLSNYGG